LSVALTIIACKGMVRELFDSSS